MNRGYGKKDTLASAASLQRKIAVPMAESGGYLVRTIDRAMALLIGLLLIILTFMFFWQGVGQGLLLDRTIDFLISPAWRLLLTILVLLVFSVYLLYMAFRRRRQEKTILCDTPLGEVRIAERAVESLALRAARKVRGVHDANIRVRATPAGLDVYVETSVTPDQSIPQIRRDVEDRVKEYIQETVGVAVTTVPVLVTRVAMDNRARVE